MQTQCVRCHKPIDTVQGYKFSPTEYLCVTCYDEYKAERAARARKEHKNPLMEKFGKETPGAAVQEPRPAAPPKPQPAAAPAAQPKAPVQPPEQPAAEPARPTTPPAGPPKAPTPPPAVAEICDVCKKPIGPFKVPLKGGKKVCMDCNNLLREIAKSLIVNVQCPHCGKEIQIAQK